MSGYIKYFDDCRKNMSFKTKDDNIFLKYNEIWDKIKKTKHKISKQSFSDDKFPSLLQQ